MDTNLPTPICQVRHVNLPEGTIFAMVSWCFEKKTWRNSIHRPMEKPMTHGTGIAEVQEVQLGYFSYGT